MYTVNPGGPGTAWVSPMEAQGYKNTVTTFVPPHRMQSALVFFIHYSSARIKTALIRHRIVVSCLKTPFLAISSIVPLGSGYMIQVTAV